MASAYAAEAGALNPERPMESEPRPDHTQQAQIRKEGPLLGILLLLGLGWLTWRDNLCHTEEAIHDARMTFTYMFLRHGSAVCGTVASSHTQAASLLLTPVSGGARCRVATTCYPESRVKIDRPLDARCLMGQLRASKWPSPICAA